MGFQGFWSTRYHHLIAKSLKVSSEDSKNTSIASDLQLKSSWLSNKFILELKKKLTLQYKKQTVSRQRSHKYKAHHSVSKPCAPSGGNTAWHPRGENIPCLKKKYLRDGYSRKIKYLIYQLLFHFSQQFHFFQLLSKKQTKKPL